MTEKPSAIFYDCDGVLTDNTVIVSEDGIESITFHRGDGMAIARIGDMGIPQFVISSERVGTAAVRCKKLSIPYFYGVMDKAAKVKELCTNLENAIFIGNDINDISAMEIVGYPMCPSDAEEEAKSISTLIIIDK